MAFCICAIIAGSILNPGSTSVAPLPHRPGGCAAELPILVLTMPGQNTVTPMLVSASSARSASIMPTTANLEAV